VSKRTNRGNPAKKRTAVGEVREREKQGKTNEPWKRCHRKKDKWLTEGGGEKKGEHRVAGGGSRGTPGSTTFCFAKLVGGTALGEREPVSTSERGWQDEDSAWTIKMRAGGTRPRRGSRRAQLKRGEGGLPPKEKGGSQNFCQNPPRTTTKEKPLWKRLRPKKKATAPSENLFPRPD